MKVYWSQRLDALADRFYEIREADTAADPFARTAVVVPTPLRGDWLKARFLLDRPAGRRRILSNLDIRVLPEFVNDWLSAAVDGIPPADRKPAEHPYSKEMLQWRIDGILAASPDDFPVLARYFGRREADRPIRRFALAGKLAAMFDDYQACRPEMLARWARSPDEPAESTEAWQARLWKRLAEQNPGTYVRQFARIDAPDGPDLLRRALDLGIPRYASIHVFGVSSMPRAWLRFLRKLDEAGFDVRLYFFNPSREHWLDDPTVAAARRELRRELEAGNLPDDADLRGRIAENAHPVLGALGAGCQGLLGTILDETEGNVAELDRDDPPSLPDTMLGRFQRLLLDRGDREDDPAPPVADDDASVSVHTSFAPHREMEALRESILAAFARQPVRDPLRPRDILVLCADWSAYAPQIEAVFGADADEPGSIPYVLAGRPAGEGDPVRDSFVRLLDLPRGRFEANEVLDLLSIAPIAARFGLAAEDFASIRTLLRDANVRWGADDENVRATSGAERVGDRPNPFTWERGLDRILLHALSGDLPEGCDGVVEAGALGSLAPGGNAEDDRARQAAAVAAFVRAVGEIRAWFGQVSRADGWKDRLDGLVDAVYRTMDEPSARAIKAIKDAIAAVCGRMAQAARTAGAGAAHGFDTVREALAEELGGESPPRCKRADAVLFAPLREGVPVPRRLVFVCGLNDGAFPRPSGRPAFDLIGRRPSPWDPSPRASDSLALLEALCAAREKLVLSYVGHDVHTGAETPPAPALGALLDFLDERFRRADGSPGARRADHPLQAFSAEYFKKGADLRSFSAENYAVAAAIAGRAAAVDPAGLPAGFDAPFCFLPPPSAAPEGVPEDVSLDLIRTAFSDPHDRTLREIGARYDDGSLEELATDDPLRYDMSRRDVLETVLVRDIDAPPPPPAAPAPAPEPSVQPPPAAAAAPQPSVAARRARRAEETGAAPDRETAEAEIRRVWEAGEAARTASLDGGDAPPEALPGGGLENVMSLVEAVRGKPPVEFPLDLDVAPAGGASRRLRVSCALRLVELPAKDGAPTFFNVVTTPYADHDFCRASVWVDHLAANASGRRAATILLQVRMDKKGKIESKRYALVPIEPEAAKARLAELAALLCEPAPHGFPFVPDRSKEWPLPQGTPPGRVREVLRDIWFPNSSRMSSDRPERQARLLWPAGPESLPDDAVENIRRAADVFWRGFDNCFKSV